VRRYHFLVYPPNWTAGETGVIRATSKFQAKKLAKRFGAGSVIWRHGLIVGQNIRFLGVTQFRLTQSGFARHVIPLSHQEYLELGCDVARAVYRNALNDPHTIKSAAF
jgi:hypothetical protein